MFLDDLNTLYIPNAEQLAPGIPWSPAACVLIGAICLQESGGENVQQVAAGPAKGFPQFEVEAIRELLENPASASQALSAVRASGILGNDAGAASVSGGADGGAPLDSPSQIATVVWTNFLNFPELQICLARLMLWDNPNPLPDVGDCAGAWNYYTATWRPGKPRPGDWDANYAASLTALSAQPSGD
jgi:hypothetical protein